MKTAATSLLALAALCAMSCAHAEDKFYLGASVGQRSALTLRANGVTEQDTSESRAFGLRGGVEIDPHWAIEGGYTSFGKHAFASGASVRLGALYLAGKGSVALGERFSLFGKVGVARQSIRLSGAGAADGSDSKARALFGAGAVYRINEQVDLSAELVDYGTVHSGAGKLTLRQLEAGLNWRF